MDVDQLLGVLEENNTRRSKKVTNLELSHQPVIYEITVAEKEAHRKHHESLETEIERENDVMKVIIRSMCEWDKSGEITQEHIDKFKAIYSPDVVWELYRSILDFGYMGPEGVAAAKKS